jgi:BirA family biotin operon repressor/biotin-[acetyl-CoA-carboxylase] ligase
MIDDDGSADILDARHLAGLPFVRHVELHAVATSTNDLALRAVSNAELPVPALIVAERQTAGRGRGNNRWWSGPGALTFSLILEPAQADLTTRRWPRLSLTTAMAVCDALAELAPQADWGIKWPNDVQVGGRKIGGILVEAPNHGGTEDRRVVVGIGVNVNNSCRDAPEDLRQISTSLCDVTGRDADRTDVLARFLSAFAVRLGQLASGETVLADQWRRRCVLRGRQVRIDSGRGTIAGCCHGIAEDGALIVETDTGIQRLHGGVVGQ